MDKNQENTQQNQMEVIQKPRVSLNEIMDGFARSVNNGKLDESTKSFAAKLMQLTNHVQFNAFRNAQFATKVAQRITAIETSLKELIELISNPDGSNAQPVSQQTTEQGDSETPIQSAGAQIPMPQSTTGMIESAAAEAARLNHTAAKVVPIRNNANKPKPAPTANAAINAPIANPVPVINVEATSESEAK